MKYLHTSLEENQIPYELHVFKITQATMVLVYQVYYVSYESNQAHLSLGTKEIKIILQRKHTLHPKHPFCIHNVHLSKGIQALDTIELKCTQLKVALSKCLNKIRNLLVLSHRREVKCFQA